MKCKNKKNYENLVKILIFVVFVNIVFLINLNISYGVDVSTCQTLSADTTYRLTANINNQGSDCFVFGGNNIDFDCDYNTIDGVSGSGANGEEAFTTRTNSFSNLIHLL